jgi:hypothetical protein
MSAEIQKENGCIIGVNYPAPIVDLKTSTKTASNQLWAVKKSYASKSELKEILNKLSHRNTEDEVKLGEGVVDRESTFKKKRKKATQKPAVKKETNIQVKLGL